MSTSCASPCSTDSGSASMRRLSASPSRCSVGRERVEVAAERAGEHLVLHRRPLLGERVGRPRPGAQQMPAPGARAGGSRTRATKAVDRLAVDEVGGAQQLRRRPGRTLARASAASGSCSRAAAARVRPSRACTRCRSTPRAARPPARRVHAHRELDRPAHTLEAGRELLRRARRRRARPPPRRRRACRSAPAAGRAPPSAPRAAPRAATAPRRRAPRLRRRRAQRR